MQNLAMGRKQIYAGWTQNATRRVWVRVPAELKQNGNGHHANGHRAGANGNGAGPLDGGQVPVVLVHGIGASSRSVEPLLLALGESRPVFAPDLPGFGLSDAPSTLLSVPELADALRRWMIDNEIVPAVLVASASGCQVAIDLAARHPALVERLVLAGPTMDPESRSPGRLARGLARSISRDSLRRTPGAIHDLLDAGPWRAARTVRRAFDDPTEQKLPQIEAATLVLCADADRLAPQGWAKRIASAIPDADLKTIPAAPRASAASAAPAVAEVIGEYLSAELPPRTTESERNGAAPSGGARLIVDGMNVIGSRPDGWWRDRPRAWRELRRDLERHVRKSGDDVVLVLDGRRPAGWREDQLVETAFAAGGRDAADDAIVARVKADPHPATLSVVTSDRELADRIRELGAETLPAATFRAEL